MEKPLNLDPSEASPTSITTPGPEPSTQDKQRRRVYLACQACRSRHIKCDGGQPICSTCLRRKGVQCVYDEVPTRRGPDRQIRSRPYEGINRSSRRSKKPALQEKDILTTSSDASASTSTYLITASSEALPVHIDAFLEKGPRNLPQPQIPASNEDSTTTPLTNLGGSPSASISTRPAELPEENWALSQLTGSASYEFPLHKLPSPPVILPRPSSHDLDLSRSSRRSKVMPSGSAGSNSNNGPAPQLQMQPSPLGATSPHISDNGTDSSPDNQENVASADTLLFSLTYPPLEIESREFAEIAAEHGDNSENSSARDSFDLRAEQPTRQRTAYTSISVDYSHMLQQPSLEFNRQTWWDSLTSSYGPARAESTRQIMDDLAHLFRVSNYFVSFLNVPLFFSNLYKPDQRENLQPSLILSMLALSTLLKSSELGLGPEGRRRAIWLGDQAQSALQASLNAEWITPSLAQAALILTIFEVSCHPRANNTRILSSLPMLDGIICALGLLAMDENEPSVPQFSRNDVPSIKPAAASTTGTAHNHSGTCSCSRLKLSATTPSAKNVTPFWLSTPGWDPSWSILETKREEHRRLVWSALTLSTAHLTYLAARNERPLSLFITKPWLYRVMFPGESLYERKIPVGGRPSQEPSPKDSVWALYARSQLLYASCLHVQYDESINPSAKGEFAVRAWLEAESLRAALDRHSCDIERSSMYHGREYLFNTQSIVTSQFSRYVPHPILGDPTFHRDKALTWLNHQQKLASYMLGGLQYITGMEEIVLANRPYFIFWFYSQIARYLAIWHQDHTLLSALELSKSLLPAVEYLASLFPCDNQRREYEILHHRLVEACLVAGISIPPPPNYFSPPIVL